VLITRVLGDCPGCGGKNSFGNVSVCGSHVLRGCMSCKYSTTVWLPQVRKKIIYLDQFFFSGAFREGDKRFVDAAHRISHLSALQLLVVPFSSIHEDETHQWGGYDGKNKENLMEFIKATSRGHEFEPAYDVERIQIIRAFQAFLIGHSPEFALKESDVVKNDIHEWDDYFRFDVGRYVGNIELIRDLKLQSVEQLVASFEGWRQSSNTFDQDLALEIRAAGKNYLDSYFQYLARLVGGDFSALFDSPIMSTVIQQMLLYFPDETQPEDQLKQVANFFISKHFAEIPYQWLSTRMFATLKDMVKRGAHANREKALNRLSGFFHDVKHVATYAPYCDAFIMDQPMAALVSDPHVGLEKRYGVKVYSLNNWDELFDWLDIVEAEMSEEHRSGLSAAYP
jgi:hypothetical protein